MKTVVLEMINIDSVCYKIFKKYGWEWGGDWTSIKDCQHFEKNLEPVGTIRALLARIWKSCWRIFNETR
jgi:hypothetical protein